MATKDEEKESPIRGCSCRNAFQDATYGPGKRVHTRLGQSGKGKKGWRCTVCGKETLV